MTLINIDLTGAKPKRKKPCAAIDSDIARSARSSVIPDFELPKPRTKSQRNAGRSQRPNWPY